LTISQIQTNPVCNVYTGAKNIKTKLR